ncbi:MAG: hypothetical protein KAH35_04385 [Candidatus Atribacteria bacterium]|nr:hypothetical protein [Candidatus Atribacteria bacterium]
MEKRAKIILDKIAEKNKDTFKLFSKKNLENKFKDTNVETIYIPGNHDRLCWMISELRQKAIQLLGLNANNEQNFKHFFTDDEHGVYATHGHIFDNFNYEGGSEYSDLDYGLVPIGDPITTEILAKVPYKLMDNIELINALSCEDVFRLRENFQELGNIRPFWATLKWLLYQVNENIAIKGIIEDTIDEVMVEFNDLKYVKKWYKHHDKWYNPFDRADMIQAGIYFLEKFKILSFEKLSGIIDYAISKIGGHGDIDAAVKLFYSLNENIKLWLQYGPPKKDLVAVYRATNLTAEQIKDIVVKAEKQVDKKYGFLMIAAHLLDWLFLGAYFFRRLISCEKYPICSWVVADAFAKAGKDFGIEVGMATPDDIWDFVVNNPDKYKEIHPLKLLSQE